MDSAETLDNLNRRFPRRQIDQAVGILYRGKYKMGRIKEISEGGLLLDTDFELKDGDEFIVTLKTFRTDWVSTRAISLYKKGSHFGVVFKSLPFQSRRHIRNLVASMASGSKYEISVT